MGVGGKSMGHKDEGWWQRLDIIMKYNEETDRIKDLDRTELTSQLHHPSMFRKCLRLRFCLVKWCQHLPHGGVMRLKLDKLHQ